MATQNLKGRDYTELLTSVKEQLWLDSPVVARRLTVDSDQLQCGFVEREWTDLDRFMQTQEFLHDKAMSSDSKMKFEGVHGLWELAVHGEHRQHFSQEVLRVLVATLDAHSCVPAQTCAAAALWCLASTAAVRTRMLAVHAVQGLLRMLMRCSLPAFDMQPEQNTERDIVNADAAAIAPDATITTTTTGDAAAAAPEQLQRVSTLTEREERAQQLNQKLRRYAHPALFRGYAVGALALLLCDTGARQLLTLPVLTAAPAAASESALQAHAAHFASLCGGHAPIGWHVLMWPATHATVLLVRDVQYVMDVRELAAEVCCALTLAYLSLRTEHCALKHSTLPCARWASHILHASS